MKVETLVNILGAEFYTGVPVSQLKALCNYLINTYGIDSKHHVIAANEGNCTALAAGYHLATGKVPVVYMQNSGEGNIINPVASLLNEKVYASDLVTIGEDSVIPDGVSIGKNTAISGVTEPSDYPDGMLAGGGAIIKEGDRI